MLFFTFGLSVSNKLDGAIACTNLATRLRTANHKHPGFVGDNANKGEK
ncbi:hypothetical protein KXD93_05565 [Mucilaginibacter sp. BJC16-A38]|nr:hypothetical protein [Mucilaginibacter phenanthrenivorans]MCR8557097.1 hypothetical protein [Mucilaginibacter phenanthrenivorans]